MISNEKKIPKINENEKHGEGEGGEGQKLDWDWEKKIRYWNLLLFLFSH